MHALSGEQWCYGGGGGGTYQFVLAKNNNTYISAKTRFDMSNTYGDTAQIWPSDKSIGWKGLPDDISRSVLPIHVDPPLLATFHNMFLFSQPASLLCCRHQVVQHAHDGHL